MTIYKLENANGGRKYYISHFGKIYIDIAGTGIKKHTTIKSESELQEHITKEVGNGFLLEVVRL